MYPKNFVNFRNSWGKIKLILFDKEQKPRITGEKKAKGKDSSAALQSRVKK